MKRSILLAVALFVAALPVIAAPLVLKTGQPFIKASKQIHAAGWRADPVIMQRLQSLQIVDGER